MLNSKCLNLETKNIIIKEQSQMIWNMLWLEVGINIYRFGITKQIFRLKQLNLMMMLEKLNSQMTLEFYMLELIAENYINIM